MKLKQTGNKAKIEKRYEDALKAAANRTREMLLFVRRARPGDMHVRSGRRQGLAHPSLPASAHTPC